MDATPIIEAGLTLIAAVITAFIVPYIKSKTSEAQQKKLTALVEIAVMAAEQIFRETGMGKQKKAYVLNWLSERGVTVDESKLDALIESAVYSLKEGQLWETRRS